MADGTTGSGTMPARSPSRGLIALIFAALFVTGLLGGVALDRLVLHHRHGPFAGMRPGPEEFRDQPERRTEMQKRLADRITRELDLSADQRRQLEALLPRHATAFDSLRTEMDLRLRALLDSSAMEVEGILTPEQKTKWAEIRRHMGEHGPPPPP
jgi:hypothetical protein